MLLEIFNFTSVEVCQGEFCLKILYFRNNSIINKNNVHTLPISQAYPVAPHHRPNGETQNETALAQVNLPQRTYGPMSNHKRSCSVGYGKANGL